jgi:hypothetical protein
LAGRCSAIKPDGERCRGIAATGSEWCPAHDPAREEARRRAASKGGRSRGSGGEIARLKDQLEDLASGVLSGDVERGAAIAVNQIINTRARLIELERKIHEQEVLERRIEALEEHAAAEEARWGA